MSFVFELYSYIYLAHFLHDIISPKNEKRKLIYFGNSKPCCCIFSSIHILTNTHIQSKLKLLGLYLMSLFAVYNVRFLSQIHNIMYFFTSHRALFVLIFQISTCSTLPLDETHCEQGNYSKKASNFRSI